MTVLAELPTPDQRREVGLCGLPTSSGQGQVSTRSSRSHTFRKTVTQCSCAHASSGLASRAACRHLQHMCVDHGGAQVRVPQQFLHRADVRARLQQMRGEGMAPGVYRHRPNDARRRGSQLDGAVQAFYVQMVSSPHPRARIDRSPRRRKHPEPAPAAPRSGYFTASASGTSTHGAPAARSCSHSTRACANCARSPSHKFCGNITTRSLPPLPCRTTRARRSNPHPSPAGAALP